MRKIYLFFIAQLIISTLVQAQSPQRFSYQAVLRNASNALLSNQSIGMRISILQGSATGTASYVETHTATTSAQGLINLEIGGGTVVSGSLSGINWGAGAYFVKTETDPAGGTNYSLVSTTRLQSVPYAMHASTAGNGVANGTASNQIMYWNGSSWVALDPGVNGQVLTMCNGVLTWTNGGLCPGSIGTLNCGGATKNGTLTQGTAASGVTASVPYTQGNGGVHSGQTVTSTGVVGLTATLAAGTFATGAGNLSYAISGTPAGNGSANFALNIGGKNCNLTLNVSSTGGTGGNASALCGAPNVHNPNLSYGSMIDQDGNKYKTIMIGTQNWMAENLKVSHYRNGDPIPLVSNGGTWAGLNSGASCWFNNDSSTYSCPYGKLYNAYAVNDSRNVCPIGWHVPSVADWTLLENHLGGAGIAGGKMKAIGTQYWLANDFGADNLSGFSAVGAEYRDQVGGWGPNTNAKVNNLFWLSTTQGASNSARRIVYERSFISAESHVVNHGFSIRCVMD